MIISNDKITLGQAKQLRELERVCLEHDKSTSLIYHDLMQDQRSKDSNLFFYEQGQLVAFLGMYYFFFDACEVALLVHPNYRRQGIAKKLLAYILPTWLERNVIRIVLSAPARDDDVWLRELGLTYLHTECSMKRDSLEFPPPSQKYFNLSGCHFRRCFHYGKNRRRLLP